MKRKTVLVLLAAVGLVLPAQAASANTAGTAVPKIAGGHPVTISQFPYQVALLYNPFNPTDLTDALRGGGAIVGERWILTAASGMARVSPSNLAVAVGVTSLTEPDNGRVFQVDQVIIHPTFGSMSNNIALLHLAEPIDFGGAYAAAPIQLLTPSDEAAGLDAHGVMARISGWGSLSFGGSWPSQLQAASLPITTNSSYSPSMITSDMIMAGFSQGGVATCFGDGGGPLVVTNQFGVVLQAGISSWGAAGCGDAGYPKVFTRVACFYDWIMGFLRGGPVVSLRKDDGVVMVSWPWSAGAWVLEQTNVLASPAVPWPRVPASQCQTNAGAIFFAAPATGGNTFYRLRYP